MRLGVGPFRAATLLAAPVAVVALLSWMGRRVVYPG